MSKHNIKVIAMGMLMATTMAWGIKNYLPSMMETEEHCIAPRVIDDISSELLLCYNNMDRCNQHFEACVNMYMQMKDGKELVP